MSKTSGQKKEPMSDQQFYSFIVLIVVVLGSLFIWKNEAAIKFWLFQNTVSIGLSIFLIFLATLHLLRWKFRDTRTAKRIKTLAKVWNHTDGVYVGKTPDGCKIHLPDKIRTGHVQILGATGRGKTESVILPWFMRDLWQGHSTVLIDGKGERKLLDKIEGYIESLEKKPKLFVFDLGNPDKSMRINPMRVGTPQQITDRLFQSLEFKDPFYQAVQFEIASQLIELIHEVEPQITFTSLYNLLTDDTLLSEAVSKSKNARLQTRLTTHLAESKKDRDMKTKGLVAQLTPFATGELAVLVNGGAGEFSLAELLTTDKDEIMRLYDARNVAMVILLPTLLYQEMALKLGKMLLQELAWVVAARQTPVFTPVFLDEFSAFVYKGFNQILNKARSSGVALHLSHQSIGDLESVSEGFSKAVNANTNVKCLLGLNDPTTADFFAKHLGTEEQEKTTERAKRGHFFGQSARTGDMSVREVEAYRVHPNELKHLTAGRGVIQFAMDTGTVLERIQFERLPEVAA